jgi:pimeloyl-ACP methyl ester carboxylesterase
MSRVAGADLRLPPVATFSTPDGTTITYDVDGPEGAPPVVFVHGIMGARSTWHVIAGDLSSDHRTYSIDLRGHGGSTKGGPYDIEHYAGDLIAFLEGVVCEPAVLVGHSLGGVVSAETIMRRPELVTRALLEDPPMFLGVGAEFETSPFAFVFPLMLADIREKQEREAPLEEYVASLAAMPALGGVGTMADVLGPEGSAREAQAKKDFDTNALQAAIDGSLGDHDPTRPMAVPVLVLRAEVFAAFRQEDEPRVLAGNLDVTVELIPGTSHLIHDEQPALIAKRLRMFLSMP